MISNRSFIYLKNNSLKFFSSEQILQLKFPQGLLEIQEETGRDQLNQAVASFVSENQIQTQKVIFILAEELLYQKNLPLNDPGITDESYQIFIKRVSFEPNKISKLKVYQEDSLYLIATSKELYLSVKETLEKIGWVVENVLPVTVLGKEFTETGLTYEALEHLFKQIKFVNKYDFLKVDEEKAVKISRAIKPVVAKNRSGHKYLKYIFPIVTILFFSVIFFLLFLSSSKSNNGVKMQTVVDLPTLAPSPPPVSTLTPLSKEVIRIMILNGSGIGGQAGKLKSRLEGLGFRSIETGNIEKKTGTSVVYFGSNFQAEMAGEIKKELEKTLGKMVEETTKSAELDVLVITRR